MSEHEHLTTEAYGANRSSLGIALSITILMMAAEFIGGWLSNSLALVSDAVHMLTDTSALALALFALWFSRRPATPEKSYGFYRAEILAALLNGSVLIVLSGFIFYKSFQRLVYPAPIQGSLMLAVAAIGLLANLTGAYILSRGSKGNLNVRAAFLHVLSDTLSSVGVILGGIVIVFTGLYIMDPIIGFLIGLLILRGAWQVVSESVDVLLEATPRNIKYQEVQKALEKIKGVRAVHDLHIWTITSGLIALSAHVLIEDALVSQCSAISRELKRVLKEKFAITHATLEFECESCPEGIVCRIEKE